MMKRAFFVVFLLLTFLGCNKDCKDSEACNYDMSGPCKYSYDEDALLVGTWNLVDIIDQNGNCVFSFSSQYDCELDNTIESINLIFNSNFTCQVITEPDDFSSDLDEGIWSINICNNTLSFDYMSAPTGPLPFAFQKIIQLFSYELIFEDSEGNVLRWEKI